MNGCGQVFLPLLVVNIFRKLNRKILDRLAKRWGFGGKNSLNERWSNIVSVWRRATTSKNIKRAFAPYINAPLWLWIALHWWLLSPFIFSTVKSDAFASVRIFWQSSLHNNTLLSWRMFCLHDVIYFSKILMNSRRYRVDKLQWHFFSFRFIPFHHFCSAFIVYVLHCSGVKFGKFYIEFHVSCVFIIFLFPPNDSVCTLLPLKSFSIQRIKHIRFS